METRVIGYWNEKKEKLRQNYPNLSEDDLNYYQGKEKEMIEILGYKLGKTKEEMRNLLLTL
jgi:hypothetical protein